MPRVAIVTDSNSGITVNEGKALGVPVVPMPVEIDGEVFFEGLDLTQEMFYERMLAGADISTSQPAPGTIMNLWDEVLREYDQLVYIPMTAGLSNSCSTARGLAQEYGGRVEVADNRRISVTQQHSVMDALAMAEAGMDAAAIRALLEEQADDSTIFISVDTLKYLRKGGRVSGAEAVAGTMLNIKPIMEIRSEKLNVVSKVRGMKAARKLMIQKTREDVETRLKPLWDSGHLAIKMAYSQVPEELVEEWRAEIHAAFPEFPEVTGAPLTLSIATHVGPGALGVGAVRI